MARVVKVARHVEDDKTLLSTVLKTAHIIMSN